MDGEPAVAQTDIADLPAEFGPAAVLLDVREDDEWSRGHAAGAQHIPMGEVAAGCWRGPTPDARWSPTMAAPAASDRVAPPFPRRASSPG
jgi:rhodanese-related sulfurtransferase